MCEGVGAGLRLRHSIGYFRIQHFLKDAAGSELQKDLHWFLNDPRADKTVLVSHWDDVIRTQKSAGASIGMTANRRHEVRGKDDWHMNRSKLVQVVHAINES